MNNDTGVGQIVDANNQFALNILEKVKDEGENLFFSPYSLSEAMGMLLDGARGKTGQEMDKAFKFPTDGLLRRSSFLALDEQLRHPGALYSLDIANALWVQQELKVLDEFHNDVLKYFKGEARGVDFKNATEQARIIINEWVKEKTKGKIVDPISPNTLSNLTRLVLANAIYFKGDWLTEFEKKATEEQDFYVNKKKTVRVKMMSIKEEHVKFNYYHHKKFQLVELPYKGEELSMLILLPNDKDTKWLEKHLNLKDLNEWRAGMRPEEVHVSLPQFKLNCRYMMGSVLAKLGMKTAFDLKKADFSGIDGTKDLFVSEVIHQAYLDVNEVGTEAAAVTIVAMCAGAPAHPSVYCDHPFLFIIQHRKSGNILFLGRLGDPSA